MNLVESELHGSNKLILSVSQSVTEHYDRWLATQL